MDRDANDFAPALATVEESTAQTAAMNELLDSREDSDERDDAPATPTQLPPQMPIPFRSPAALSEMSGTTAISSFSMVEADFLEPKYIVKHLRKLCESAAEFLEYLVPDRADMYADLRNMTELQKPDSDFTDDYRDYEVELNVHLRHYKSEDHTYIHIRALHRALFASSGHAPVAQTGLDAILYLANLLVFVKQMITSNRNSKATWDVLRQLDNSFPSHFMAALVPRAEPTTPAGESALLKETFELALELRTQLAIMVLARQENHDHNDQVIDEVFLRSESPEASTVRGWNVPGLEAEEPPLPQEFEDRIASRCDEIRKILTAADTSPDENLTFLQKHFPWDPTVLRLLSWVRLRHRELKAVISELGGSTAIVRIIQQTREALEASADGTEAAEVAENIPAHPRRKRKSFGRDRRRSSRKFDPTAPLDPRLMDAFKARERLSGTLVDVEQISTGLEEVIVEPTIENSQEEVPSMRSKQNLWQPVQETVQDNEQLEDQASEPALEDNENATLVAESPPHLVDGQEQLLKQQHLEQVEAEGDQSVINNPPKSTAELLSALKAVSNPQKENRPIGLFDRHITAQRVEFGNGFDDSQPTPGPSNRDKGKRQAQQSPRKRRRSLDEEDETATDEFETIERGSRVQRQRLKAPPAKRVRIVHPPSDVPPGHQPRPHGQQQEQNPADDEAPDITDAPPPSSYRAQCLLAQQNRLFPTRQPERKTREAWTVEEEEALIEYMSMYPGMYATILERDSSEGRYVLQNRSQVNLKDKARSMAINMIKYVVACWVMDRAVIVCVYMLTRYAGHARA